MIFSKQNYFSVDRQLCLMVEMENAEYLFESQYRDTVTAAVGQVGVVKAEHITIEYHQISNCSFETVKDLPFKELVTPLHFELYFSPDKNVCKIRFRTVLTVYDGVSAMHTCFNILEYLQHGTVDALTPFQVANPSYTYTFRNLAQLAYWTATSFCRLTVELFQWLKSIFIAKSVGKRRHSGPWTALLHNHENTFAQCVRYQVSKQIQFSEMLRLIDKMRADLGFEGYICTVNYRPRVALARVSTLEQLFSKEARCKGLVLPARIPPSPGFLILVGFASYCFFNNYGRWNPNIHGDVTGVYWDWIYLPKSLPLVVFTMTVREKCWVVFRSSNKSLSAIREYTDNIGLPQQLTTIRSSKPAIS